MSKLKWKQSATKSSGSNGQGELRVLHSFFNCILCVNRLNRLVFLTRKLLAYGQKIQTTKTT